MIRWSLESQMLARIQTAPLATAALGLALMAALAPEARAQPYPPSEVITGVELQVGTHDRRAPGSDNWPITWADDDHQYTAWGDGGGFGGTNSDGRVSLGIARVEGTASDYTGTNVWGGKDPEHAATFEGKSYGIISIAGELYMWVSPGSGATGYTQQTLYHSTDHAASWSPASWSFQQDEDLVFPTILQFGKDYAGARDDYVYHYAIRLEDASDLQVQTPGAIDLLRVPKSQLMQRDAYELFAGLDGNDNPIWTADIAQRQPVFEDASGVGWNVSVSYNAGLQRYLLCTEHTASSAGNLGIFDAPEPWGPWTTVGYYSDWEGFGTTFFWNFSNKWTSADGRDFTLVFTGIGDNDSWNTVRGSFQVAAPVGPDAGPIDQADAGPGDGTDAGEPATADAAVDGTDAGDSGQGANDLDGGCAGCAATNQPARGRGIALLGAALLLLSGCGRRRRSSSSPRR